MDHQSSLTSWIKEEFTDISFNDNRLKKRFEKVAQGLAEKSEKNISSSFESWSEIKGCYRFFNNEKVTCSRILRPHSERTLKRIREHKRVLFLQDTVVLSYGKRLGATGLDFCHRNLKSEDQVKGLILHGQLAISDKGLPLGVIHQEFTSRKRFKGPRTSARTEERKKQPIKKKESFKWIGSIEKSKSLDTGDSEIIHVADREGDIYELYKECSKWKEKYLIRASVNRSINKKFKSCSSEDKLFDFLLSKKAQGRVKVRLSSARKGRKYREAKLSIIYKEITLPPPRKKPGKELPFLPMTAVVAVERNAPRNENPIKWILLTNVPVSSVEEAQERVRWYSMRWNIELFHKVLKSGFAVEKTQMREGERIKKYVTLKSILAWRIFWLTRYFDENKTRSCEIVLTEYEWKVLYKKFNKGRSLPKKPPPIEVVFIWLGRLGGFIGRRGDGTPGFMSLWRGWMRFMDLLDDYQTFCG